MSGNLQFRVPQSIPQDLLLIQDIVGELPTTQALKVQKQVVKTRDEAEDISSSGSESDSEDELEEVEADLIVKVDDEEEDSIPPKRCMIQALLLQIY